MSDLSSMAYTNSRPATSPCPGVPTPEHLAAAEALVAEARRHLAEREASFERCDTNGYLSQWASGLTAREREAQADVLRHGCWATFRGLYHGNRRVRARLIETKFGTTWLLDDEEDQRYGRRFIPSNPEKAGRIQRALGLCERSEWAPAWAKLESNGYGTSGTCWVATVRTGCRWGSDAVLQADVPGTDGEVAAC